MTTSPNVNRASLIMIISILMSRVLGLLRESIMSGMFGASGLTDAYVLAFSVPDLLFFLIAGGALSSAFIPVFSEYWHTDRREDAWKIFSSVTTIMSVVVLSFIVLAWVFAPQLTAMTASGKDAELMPLITYMSRILLPAQFAFFIGGILFGTLYARQVFAVPGLGPNIYNLGIICGAVIISNFVEPGIVGMAWGALVGAMIGNLMIPAMAMAKLGSQFKVSFDVSHPGVRKVFILMLPVILGLSLPGVFAIIMRYFGSFYADGVNTWLNYANQLMQAPLGVFGQSMAIAAFPALSQFFAQGDLEKYRAQLTSTLRTTLFLSVPSAVFLYVLSVPLVASFYQHGKFTASDTQQVSALLGWFAIGIPAWCLHPVLMRAFFAAQKTVTPIVLGTLTTGIFVGVVFLLQSLNWSYASLPLGSSISAVMLVIMLLVAIKRTAGELELSSLLTTLSKAGVAASIAGGCAFGLLAAKDHFLGNSGKVAVISFTLLSGLIAAWIYYFVAVKLGMREADLIRRAMNRKSAGTNNSPNDHEQGE